MCAADWLRKASPSRYCAGMHLHGGLSALISALLVGLTFQGSAQAAPPPGFERVSQAQAKKMATQTGFATKSGTPKRCWRAYVVTSDPRFGTVYKSQWGRAHDSAPDFVCGNLEWSSAPISALVEGRWVPVGDMYSPDCKDFKADLRSYGASEDVIRTLVTVLPNVPCAIRS